MARDNQRSKLYKAERQCEMTYDGGGRVFESLEEIEAYVSKLLKYCWLKTICQPWQNRIPVKIVVKSKRVGASGSPYSKTISFSKAMMTQAIVLHEVIHVILPPRIEWHGREFCSIFLKLVKHELGREKWLDLKQSFKDNNVRWQIKRSRPDLQGKVPSYAKREETEEEDFGTVESSTLAGV